MSSCDVSCLGEEKSTEDILKNLEDKPIQVDIPQTVLMKMDETDEYGKNNVSIVLHCVHYSALSVHYCLSCIHYTTDTDNVKAKALANVQFAVEKHKAKVSHVIIMNNITMNTLDSIKHLLKPYL